MVWGGGEGEMEVQRGAAWRREGGEEGNRMGGNGRHGGKEELEYVANRSKIKKNC